MSRYAPDLTPIPTTYRGYSFRSRLEARWAVFFDTMGLTYEYEPQGYNLGGGLYYLPDFWLPQVRCFAEVKPREPSRQELDKLVRLVCGTGFGAVLLVGPPDFTSYPLITDDSARSWKDVAGCDAIIDTSYLDEHRFFHGTGYGFGAPRWRTAEKDARRGREEFFDEDYVRAVDAARAARFDGRAAS